MLANHPNVLSGGGVATNIIGGTGLFADGSAAAPSISFASTINTGFYKYNSNAIGFSAAGSDSLLFSANGYIYGAYGTAQFIQLNNPGNIALVAAGADQNITLTPSGTGQVIGPVGTASLPGFSFAGNTAQGIAISSSRVALVSSGSVCARVINATYAGLSIFNTLTFAASSGSALDARIDRTGSISAASLVFSTGADTTALTLDSSQNATFVGSVRAGNFTTAGAPPYAKGVIYFDTTLNKLRVGGATAFETITSV